MKAYQNLPIKWKLASFSVFTCGIALILACTFFLGYESVELPKETAAELATVAEMTAANTVAPLAFVDRGSADGILRALRADNHIIEACIYDRAGKVFGTYVRRGGIASFPARPGAADYYFENDSVIVFRPVILSGETIGSIYLRSDLEKVHSRLRRYSTILGAAMFAACLVAFLFSSWLQAALRLWPRTTQHGSKSLADSRASGSTPKRGRSRPRQGCGSRSASLSHIV